MIYAAYISLSVVLIALLQALVYRLYGYKNVNYTREYTPSTVFEGETTVMTEKISNSKVLPLPWIRVESLLNPDLKYVSQSTEGSGDSKRLYTYGEHNSVFSIAPYTTVTRKYVMHCSKRGYYNLRAVNLTCQDIFGLGDFKSAEAEINAAVTVYPQLISFGELGDLSKNLMGDVVVRRWIAEDPFMIRGTRDYTPQDPQSSINWKASAKTGELMVNEYDYTADIRLMIYFNVDADEWWINDPDPECIEKGLSITASVVQYAIEHGIETAFASNSTDSPLGVNRTGFGTGHGHLADIFTQLAACKRISSATMHKFLAFEVNSGISDCGILIVTAYVNEDMQDQIDLLRSAGNKVEILLLDRFANIRTEGM